MKKSFQIFQNLKDFENINSEMIRDNPELLKVVRLSLGMSIHEFERTFGMYQQSRYERDLYKPGKAKVEALLKQLRNYRPNFDSSFIEETEKQFLRKHEGGEIVGLKTLFRKGDARTKKLANKGARLGGIATLQRHGKNHMALLAGQIKRGRMENKGFRSKAEMLVAQALDELGVNYEYEKPLNGFLPDFQIGENRVLEVMCMTTEDYKRNQLRKIEAYKGCDLLIVTNFPEFFASLKNTTIRVVKFSKSVNVLKERLGTLF